VSTQYLISFTIDNCSPAGFFAVGPSLSVTTEILTFTTAADVNGWVTCKVTLTEQMPNGLSAKDDLTIYVQPGRTHASDDESKPFLWFIT
jgi:hypothetical protein